MIKVKDDLVRVINLAKNNEFQKALRLGKSLQKKIPNSDVLANTLGIIYRRLGKFREGRYWSQKAIETNPKFWAAHNNLARVYHDLGEIEQSLDIYKKLVSTQPTYIEGRANYALALKSIGDYSSSLREYEQIMMIKKSNKVAFHLSLTKLTLGNFKDGYGEYEARWKADPLSNAVWPIQNRELWEGQDGKKVLLWKEQGIGDDILFLGLVLEAYKRTKFLTVYTDNRLISLCERGMPGVVFKPYKNKIDDKDFDYHLPMGSLPRLFRSDIKDFENTVTGYLKADKERVESLRKELGLGDKKVVGISWKSIKSLHTQKKSISLKEFGKLFKDLDIVLLNLQYGDVDNEIKEFTNSMGIEVLQCSSVDNREDLDGLAALIELCDLVVSTSNVTIHLAGALGKETWVLLPYVANFWWLLDRTDSIWYPTLKLYRQKKFQDWITVPLDVKRDLKRKFFS